jgi:predicted NBD/HSP70 family sugar kinase
VAPNSIQRDRRNDRGRQANLSALLRRVHAAPSPRSELTRLSGLNRSTVAALVAELVDRGLVVEDESDGGGLVGRPSPVVRPADRAVAIAVHPEIDAVRVAAVLLGGRVLCRVRVEADRPSPDAVIGIVCEALPAVVAQLPHGAVVLGAGVAVPGLVRVSDGFVRLAPHLGWRGVPLAALLAEALDVPVGAANEASLGASAEWVFGAGRGARDLLYVNGGRSGIGGGIVAGGVPLLGASGHAGEVGHVTVTADGARDSAGLAGTLEAAVSRAALTQALAMDLPDDEGLERALLDSDSGHVAAEVDRQVDALAVALGGVVNVLGSERVVLGGFLGALAAVAEPRLHREFDRHLLAPMVGEVELRRAELGADLLLVGAASIPFEGVLREVPHLGLRGARPHGQPPCEDRRRVICC